MLKSVSTAQPAAKTASVTRFMALVFSIGLFSVASALFIKSAIEYTQGRHQFLHKLNLSGFVKIQLNDVTQYLYLQQLNQNNDSILQEIISRETGFQISRIKTYRHQGKNSPDQISLSVAEVNFDANGSSNNSRPQRNLYMFFVKNFKVLSAQRITALNENSIQLEYGYLKKYNPQFAEGTFQLTENIEF